MSRSPGDMAVTRVLPVASATHTLWRWDGRAWRGCAALRQGTVVTVVGSLPRLFEDGLPGCLVLVSGSRPVLGWLAASRLVAWPNQVMVTRDEGPLPPDGRHRTVVRASSPWAALPKGSVVCPLCGQWYSYGIAGTGPCKDSRWDVGRDGAGRRDPAHDWVSLVEDGHE